MIYLISFPRSGQHLIRNLLEGLCKRYDIPFQYCEYFRCCRKVPCKYKSNCMKNHDFLLDDSCPDTHFKIPIEINDTDQYIVLYRRDAIEQLEAWYRYFNKDYVLDDVVEFCKKKLPYYNAFVEKWVNCGKINVHVVDYNELVASPYVVFSGVLAFLYPDVSSRISISDVREVVDFHHVQKKMHMSEATRNYICEQVALE